MGSIPITRSILYNYLVQGKLYYIHSVRLANSKAKNKANIVEIQGGSVMFWGVIDVHFLSGNRSPASVLEQAWREVYGVAGGVWCGGRCMVWRTVPVSSRFYDIEPTLKNYWRGVFSSGVT